MGHKVICADCHKYSASADIIFTDPPYEMSGFELHKALSQYSSDHLVMLVGMKQLLEFSKHTKFGFCFDFVLDNAIPKKQKSRTMPVYTHSIGVYFKRKKTKSIFNRFLRKRTNVFVQNGYWPSIIKAPRNRMKEHGLAKNQNAITDILGSFEGIKSVVDPFAGSGTTALAAIELGLSSISIEKEPGHCENIVRQLKFLGEKAQV